MIEDYEHLISGLISIYITYAFTVLVADTGSKIDIKICASVHTHLSRSERVVALAAMAIKIDKLLATWP